MIIEKVTDNDIDDILILHKVSFPNNFMTKLGDEFLKSYYSLFVKYDICHFICIRNEENRKIEGYVCGVKNSKQFYRKLKYHSVFFIRPLFWSGIKNFSMLSKIFNKVLLVFTKNKVNNINISNSHEEILSIAVKKNSRGLGTILLNKYIDIAQKNSKKKGFFITTDNTQENMRVIKFYEKNCFLKSFEFIQYPNRRMVVYQYDFK